MFINTLWVSEAKPYPLQAADREILPKIRRLCPGSHTEEVEPEPGCGPYLCLSFCKSPDSNKGAISCTDTACAQLILATETS